MYHPTNVAEELLPIVNEKDEVIGTEKRAIIHAKKLLHRAVHILIFNTRNQVYIQQRSLQKDSAPGKWDSSASGHVDPGEDYLGAAQRELEEELMIATSGPLEEIARIGACRQTGNEFTRIFVGHTTQEPNPNPHEIMDGRWIDPVSLEQWMSDEPKVFAGCFRLVWKTFREDGLE